jgi:RimJ/RimL family protein N-acetyltransferase
VAEIGTERLIMRGWRESDLAPWAAMNADPEVRRYVGPLLTFEQAAAWVLNYQDDLDRYGFGTMGLPEIIAVTMARNGRSQAVMRRIGMTTDPAEDFDDPDVDEDSLRRHVVYRKVRDPEPGA